MSETEFEGVNTAEPTSPVGTTDPGISPDSVGNQDVEPRSSSGSEPSAEGKTGEIASISDAINAAFEATTTETDANNPEGKAPDGADADADPDDNAPPGEVAADKQPKDGDDGTKAEGDEIPEAEIASYGKNAQKRIRKLLGDRASLRQEAETLRADAGNYQQIRTFMSTNHLVDNEVADLLLAGADLKSGNPERLGRFLDRVMPLVQQAMLATGRELPADVKSMVDNGEMTEDAAKQLARTRQQAAYATTEAQRARQQADQTRTQVEQAQIVHAVDQWYAGARQSDPDFNLKAPAIQRAAQALVAERGLPKSPAEAVEYAQRAYAEVNSWMKAARPAPKASRPTPTSQAAPRTGLSPAPTSLEAIISQALEG